LVIVLTDPKNMLKCHAISHCELFSWFIFLAECKIFNFVDVGRRTRTASLCGWPLACYRSSGLLILVMTIFYLKVSFHQYSIVCPLSRNILQKTCDCITPDDSQTLYQMSVFDEKTQNSQMR